MTDTGGREKMKTSPTEPTIVANVMKSPSFGYNNDMAQRNTSGEASFGPLHEYFSAGVNFVPTDTPSTDEGQFSAPKVTENTPFHGLMSVRGDTEQSNYINHKFSTLPFQGQHHQQEINLGTINSGGSALSPSGTSSSDRPPTDYLRVSENPFENTNPESRGRFDIFGSRGVSSNVARLEQRRQDFDTRSFDQSRTQTSSSLITATPKTRNTASTLSIFNETAQIREDHSAGATLRTDMGYSNTDQSNAWGARQSSVKMESSEMKVHDEDVMSAASTSSATSLSPTSQPVHLEHANIEPLAEGRLPNATMGTPSTTSTAPSTDDALSFEHFMDAAAFDKLSLVMDENPHQVGLQPRKPNARGLTTITSEGRSTRLSHQRSHSWDDSALGTQHTIQNQSGARSPRVSPGAFGASRAAPSRRGLGDPWSGGSPTSFRSEYSMESNPQGFAPHAAQSDSWRQQRGAQPQFYPGQHTPPGQHVHLPPSGAYHPRKVVPLPTTPPRGRPQSRPGPAHAHRQSSPSTGTSGCGGSGSGGNSNPPRSSSEVLKTLLRKKACLYEPETSRAVALVTWLVGRELAIAHGYFSRQQLQSGVHACVAKKIDSGSITRTKVNRCMQIILNSCFHYIIPRPDGSEENGLTFRKWFSRNSKDGTLLVRTLQAPWDDVIVDRELILTSSSEAEGKTTDKKRGSSGSSPQTSPRLSSTDAPAHFGEDDHSSKRAVLLCFNENVRCAEDVFRCHNEFIRDTANAAKLQLTSQEWRSFFGKDATETSSAWGPGIGSPRQEHLQDYLGLMRENDLGSFRASWCGKRYDHDHELCGFAHVEVNSGWLRRNPLVHRYRNEMCPAVIAIPDKHTGKARFSINQCSKGVYCELCHSREEMLYHPNNYKLHICKASTAHQTCKLGDICPNLHPKDGHHHMKKSSGERHGQQRHGKSHHHHSNFSGGAQGRGVTNILPSGAPMLYVHPAPYSTFDRHLAMPGLQNLFRRQSAVIRASLRTPVGRATYSNFGDEWGISGDAGLSSRTHQRGLPASPGHVS